MQLTFDVNAQTLSRTDKNSPATDSVDYLTAKFNFLSAEWNGIEKVALFKSGDVLKEAKLNASGVCVVPWEVLVKNASTQGRIYGDANRFYVSVVGINGTVQIPTVTVRVDLGASGYGEGTESEDPTPDLYAQYVAEVKGYADSVEAFASEIKDIESGIKDSYANAFKGEVSGEVVRVDDVSPVEHNARVNIKGKNLFDISKITNTDIVTNNGDGTLTISANNYYCRLNQKLSEVCPQLRAGDTAVLSFNSTSTNTKYMYFHGLQSTWNVGHYITLTDDILNSYVTIYGYADSDASYGQECIISDIQIELGKIVTEYTQYIDPITVTVTRCGKNILEITGVTETVDGVTFTVNEDGSIRVNGTAEVNVFYKVGKVTLNDRGSYYLSGSPANSSAQTYMFYLHDVKSYVDVYDYGEGRNFTPTGDTCDAVIAVYKGVTVNNVVFYPMIEAGAVKTEFKKFEAKTNYTPNTDGSVDITSLSPTMTILTDTDSVTIDLEYNRDTTAVVGDIESAVIKLNEIADSLIGGVSE